MDLLRALCSLTGPSMEKCVCKVLRERHCKFGHRPMLEAFLGLSLEEFDEYLRSSKLKPPLPEENIVAYLRSTLDNVHTLDQELNFKTWGLGCRPGKTGLNFESPIRFIFLLSLSRTFPFPLRCVLVVSFGWKI